MQEKKNKSHGVLPAQSDVQGHCHVTVARSSCTRSQAINGEMSRIDSEGSPCTGAYSQSLLLALISV
jgi:hypothetical protein